jgi:hypothetical protein
MAYALIPDGYSLKKVTKAQEQAVRAKRRHDDIMALLNNPNTPLVIGAAVLLPALIAVILEVLEKMDGVSIPEVTKSDLLKLPASFWVVNAFSSGAEKGFNIGSNIQKDLTKLFGGGTFEDLFKR